MSRLSLAALLFSLGGCGASPPAAPTPPALSDEDRPSPGPSDEDRPEPQRTPQPLPPPAEEDRPDGSPCDLDDDGCRVDRLGTVQVGWLSTAVTPAAVEARLGPPAEQEALEEEAATGEWVGSQAWPDAGVRILLSAGGPKAPPRVRGFTVRPPFEGQTDRGVGLGSTEAEVRAAYGALVDPMGSVEGERVVVGSLYGGAFFDVEGGRVVELYVGQGAE